LDAIATSVSLSLGEDDCSVGDVVSIVTLEADAADEGPVLLAESVTPPDASLAITVPSEVQTMLKVIDVPDESLGVKVQPVAVPVLLKSPDAMPLTVSLKASV